MKLVFASFIIVAASIEASAQMSLSPSNAMPSSLSNGGTSQPPIMNQPIVVQSFENVEMERLKLTEEVAKLQLEDADFREQIVKLQAKLASLSIAGLTPDSLPSNYRSFMSANAGDIQKTDSYYKLLKSVLNDLTPESPYKARTSDDKSDPKGAAEKLLTLSGYDEDDELCRTIRGHISSLVGGEKDNNRRVNEINKSLLDLENERKRLEWNLKMSYNVNPLTKKESGTNDERNFINQQIKELKDRVAELDNEKKSLSHLVTAEVRKLQFQQFIVELATQQRYIHALIASGFYRNSFKGGDLALSKEAYPAGNSPKSEKKQDSETDPSQKMPYVSTISGLEAFLLNRIRDAIKDRESINNMIQENQVAAAESLIRKLLLTSKYQPELQTLPYNDRQRIQKFSQNIRKLSNALNSKDYLQIFSLAEEIERDSADSGMADIKIFAQEHPRKALYWLGQAELALKSGDKRSAKSLMDAAIRRAPLDNPVKLKLDEIQNAAVNDSDSLGELKKVVKAQDYKSAFDRMNEFAPLLVKGSDPQLKTSYENLIEKEKHLRVTLEKCDAWERRNIYPEIWIELSAIDSSLLNDSRIAERRVKVSGKCPRFVAAYTAATEHENKNRLGQALALYLTALDESPSSEALISKANNIGNKILKKY
jgi:hypothetical protein